MVEFALLGPFEARLDGRPVSLRPKQRALLAVLALHAGEPVSVDRLVDDLWGERPPPTATASLQNAVSLARRALGSGAVVTRAGGYALDVKPERVDALRFERLLAEAQDARGEQRAELLRAALALWRGPALGDLAFEPFAATEAPRLDELRLSAREQLAETELALGRHEPVLGELEALVESSPFRERPRALLMLALYRSGRQAEALEAFGAARRVLREELGLEPSPALRALQQAMLRHDPALDPPDAAPLAHIVGEERRKTVTVVFCDLVESTVLAATLDPEAYRAVLRRYYRAARDVLERHGGVVEKFVGDAVVAVFGVPASHEDDPLRAVRAAVELRARLAELNVELEQAHGVALRSRIGINTGEAIAGEPETGQSFATGYAVNLAAKLQQAAPADGILVGAATFRLVRDAVKAEPVEPLAVGGAAAPIPAFRIAELDPDAPGVARNLQARLVGRAGELADLRAAFDEAKDADTCRVALVIGEAGIGKSRLAAEVSRLVEDEATVVVGRCVSYGEGATYMPVAEVVRRLVPDGSEAGIAALLPDAADARLVARRVRELLGWAEGAPPPGEGVWAVRRLLEGVAAMRPLLLVLEDVHWAEPTLLDLVDHLVEQGAAPVLVLCLSRPEVLETRPAWEERVVVRLAPLSDEESADLLASLAGVPADTRKRIVAIAEGNALFVEQLHAYAVEAGEAALETVPPTVDALLASRLDRLPERERSVLERAAVVGREFWRGAVDELSERSSRAELEALAVKGLVGPARSLLEGEEALAFHHVLIRDVAYAGITKERRSKLHERVAAWLDEREPSWDEVVGYHLEQAYRFRAELGPVDDHARRLADAASDRLEAAGVRAWKRADTGATTNLLGRAETLRARSDSRRGPMLCDIAGATRSVGDLDRALVLLEEAVEVAAAAGDVATELRARLELLNTQLAIGRERDPAQLLSLAREAIPVLEARGDDRSLGRAWVLIGDVHAIEGQMRSWADASAHARVHYERAGWPASTPNAKLTAALFHSPEPAPRLIRRYEGMLADADAQGDRYARATVLAFLGAVLGQRGDFERGRRQLTDARRHYEDLGQLSMLSAVVDPLLGGLELLAGEQAAAESVLRTACEATRNRSESALALLLAYLAEAVQARGAHAEAEELCRSAASHATPNDLVQIRWRAVLAKAHAHRGEHEPAYELAREAIDLLGATDALNWRAATHADFADVLLLAGAASEAAEHFEIALRLYRKKGNLVGARRTRAQLSELAVA